MSNTLILIRHGKSVWNVKNIFTGWVDVELDDSGKKEAIKSALLLKEAEIVPSFAFTSFLKRAQNTLQIILEELNVYNLHTVTAWELNERHYGALQGLNKAETAAEYGEEQVHIWRRSYSIPPPELKLDDKRHPRFEHLYSDLPLDDLPVAECLKDTVERFMPYWFDSIKPDVESGKNVLIVAHGNSLRALVKYLEKISDDDAVKELLITNKGPL